MTTPKRRPRRLTERLRAIAGRSARCTCDTDTYASPDLFGHLDPACPRYQPRSRVRVANFEHTHRVWTPPDPPRRWFEQQGMKKKWH